MIQLRLSTMLFAPLLVGTMAFAVSEYAGLPNAVDVALTGLQVLCFVVMGGIYVIVATTEKLDNFLTKDKSR